MTLYRAAEVRGQRCPAGAPGHELASRGRRIALRERGSALLLCVDLTLIIVGISGAYLSFSIINSRKTASDVNALQALYVAESGAALYIDGLNKGVALTAGKGSLGGGTWSIPAPLDFGTDKADNNGDKIIDDEAERNFVRFEAAGTYAGTLRRIEVVLSKTPGGVFWNAVFAGNSSKDPNYTLEFGGKGTQKDIVKGDIYSGGGLTTSGDAALLDETGGGPAKSVMSSGNSSHGSSAATPGYVKGDQQPLDIDSMKYDQRADPSNPLYDPSLFVNVANELATNGKKGTVKSTTDGLGTALQIDDVNNPAHLFRQDPTDGTKQRVETYGGGATDKADFFMEDPTQDVYNGMGTDFTGGKDAQRLQVSPNGNEKVYFVDGNLWFSNAPTFTFKFKHDFAQGMKMTIVVKGNIYLTDNLLYQNLADDGIALIAMEDDKFKSKAPGDFAGTQVQKDDAARDYNRKSGSGNIFFGDPGGGTTERFEGFLYAENNFYDNNLGSDGSMKTDIFGNMTAGNQVKIKRDPKKYSKLQVQLDDKIKTGKAKLPGLPGTPGFGTGDWFIASWRQVP